MNSQNSTLPSVIVDSLIFEVLQGRACTAVTKAQSAQISALETELQASGQIVVLQESKINSLDAILATWPQQLKAQGEIHRIEKQRLKKRLNRLWRVVILETGAIILILLI